MSLRSCIITSLLISFISFGQYTNIQINSSGSTDPEEVAIAVNPKNPNMLAGGANIQYFYSSSNGGANWQQKNMSSSLGVWGDPCLIYDGLGNLFYGHLSNPLSGYWIDRIVVQKSTDNGATWNDGAGIGYSSPKNQDKEWLAVNLSDGPYKNHLYVAWTEFDNYGSSSASDSSRILFSRSTDHGASWAQPVRVSDKGGDCIDEDNTVEGAVPCVGPNGEIYLSWAGPLGLMFDKSTNGGLSFGTDVFVSNIPGGWDFAVPGIQRCNGMPITACDTSRANYRGNIYIVWSDQRNGSSNTDVFFIKSTNGGINWTGFKKVNDDITDRHQFFTWMTIDQVTGFIYCVFYDRRATSGSATDVFVARSTNGGDTFENFKVSQSSFTPTSSVFFGDYTNIAAYNRKVYPIWMRMNSSALSVWTALVNDSTQTLAAPVLLSPPNNSVSQPQTPVLTWSSVPGAQSYYLQIAADQQFLNPIFADSQISGTQRTAGPLQIQTSYFWRVKCKTSLGYTPWSEIWKFTVGSNCREILLTSGWNLVSVPFAVPDMSVNYLFPQTLTPAYGYSSGYVQYTNLSPAFGYWIKYPSQNTVNICGDPVGFSSIQLSAGWNLIGVYQNNIETSQLTTTPSGILNSAFYGYQNGYIEASTLYSGKGYWIRASQSGLLQLPSGVGQKINTSAKNNPPDMLIFSDASKNETSLYFTDKDPGSGYDLPPLPPQGSFDIRFFNDRSAASVNGPSVVLLNGCNFPVKVKPVGLGVNIIIAGVKKYIGDGETLVISDAVATSITIEPKQQLESFVLLQNYPNPFNPSTTIGYRLKKAAHVNLKVYDVLGNEVITLVDKNMQAGEHEVELDAGQYNSGVYLYRLTVDGSASVKQMLLLK